MYLCIYRNSVDSISYFKYNKQENYIETITDTDEKNKLLSLTKFYHRKHVRYSPPPVIIAKIRNMQTGVLQYCNIIFAENFIINNDDENNKVIPMFIFNSRFKYSLSTMNNCKKPMKELTQTEPSYIANIYDIDYISFCIVYNALLYEHNSKQGQEDTQEDTQEDMQEDNLCPILLTPINKNNSVILNECGHQFSINGLTEYLSRCINNKCPLCRKKIQIQGYIENYIANNTLNIEN